MAAPPWTSLRDIEYAAHLFEREADDDVLDPWLAMLIAPGSSLGGARPKAGVVDPSGNLWIAKFPGRSDDHDVATWEALTSELAVACGVQMSECRSDRFSNRGSTFLTRRFARVGPARLHFASAMALLGRLDGDDASTGASYLELADFIVRHGSRPDADLRQLWHRIVFSMAVLNTDDHLRNHGFLLEEDGWRLSPAYDMLRRHQSPSSTDSGIEYWLPVFKQIAETGCVLYLPCRQLLADPKPPGQLTKGGEHGIGAADDGCGGGAGKK